MTAQGVCPEDVVAIVESGLFDPDWYLSTYADVLDSGLDPFEHFATQGWREGRSPGPAFDLAWYLTRHADVLPEGTNPLGFYLREGWRYGHWPTPNFDPDRYRCNHPEVADLDFAPIIHAVALGFV